MGTDWGACGRPGRRVRAALIFAALVAALLAAPNAIAGLYRVNSTADPGDGVCTLADCTLREAIDAANAGAGADDITFQFGIGGSFTIYPHYPLPAISDPVTIDATTQTGYAGVPLVTVDGSAAGAGADGFGVFSASTTISGLAITNFGGAGISLNSPGGDTVAGNYVGIDAGGGTAAPNADGVSITSPNNTVGGTSTADRNVISGNGQAGVSIAFAGGNSVSGNYIGLDASGNFGVPNARGVEVTSDGNFIGGSAANRNVISGNANVGIQIAGSQDNLVGGNYIGTDADGTSAVPNGAGGVQIIGNGSNHADGNQIGEIEGAENIISGNGGPGVIINGFAPSSAGSNVVRANSIGVGSNGSALGNAGSGVELSLGAGDDNFIGSTSADGGNTIANNGGSGVDVQAGVHERIIANRIYANADIGIDLGSDGVTANDPDDGDTGPNDLTNFPVLDPPTRHADGTVGVTGALDGPPSAAGTTYRLDFYANVSCDASGNGEGDHWLGTITSEPASAEGDITFVTGTSLGEYVAPGSAITAIATDASGNTSEFSACASLPAGPSTTFTVNSAADTDDGSCDPSPGDCTLREAIKAANSLPGKDTIAFDLPGGSLTISLTDPIPLPSIDDDVVIDGNTQPGTIPGAPRVRLDGSAQTATPVGLDVAGGLDGSTIRGLSITGFSNAGIDLEGAPSSVVGNFIGVEPDGTTSAGNGNGGFGDAGISIRSGDNVVGGTTAAERNVISGNDGSGIDFVNESGNMVLGNRIGTNAAGTGALPNTGDGITFEDVSFQTIGGSAPGAGNLISGNGGNGLYLNAGYDFATGRIQGNTIGLAADGATTLPNGDAGVRIESVDDVRLGGSVAGAGNVISGNEAEGVVVDNADGVRVQGNLIGTTADGLGPAANVSGGSGAELLVDGSNGLLIGGATAAARNVIGGGGSGTGVDISAGAGNTVSGNYIGVDANGTGALGNGVGVLVAAGSASNTIGGNTPGAGNVISGNSQDAIHFLTAGTGNRVLGNTIGPNAAETSIDGLGNDTGINVDGTSALTIGGTSPGAGNVIGGNSDVGIILILSSDANTIAGNFIGTDRTDALDLGNGTGIRLVNGGGSANLIAPSNVFAHNGDYGVELDEGTGNRISANSFHDNGARGIVLNGGNNAQAAPEIISASRAAATVSVLGTLASTPSTSFFVELFTSASCVGGPQGKTYFGFTSIATDGAGDASFSFSGNAPNGEDFVTATATNQTTSDTSEFAACVPANDTSTFVVTTTADHDDGTCDADCTLREAIVAANAAGVPLAHITFAIPGGGPQQIALTFALPAITAPTVIDGTTEGAPPGELGIVLNGDGAGAADGLFLAAGSGGSTIRGVAIRDFAHTGQAGIRIQSDGNLIAGNYVGLDANGTSAAGDYEGLLIEAGAGGNTVGGSSAPDRNVIAGNQDAGVLIDGTFGGADANVVSGNYIGLASDGASAAGNLGPGVRVTNATNTVVGGASPAEGNVIANNFNDVFLGDFDVATSGNSSTVRNNLLGLSADQTASFTNSGNGVEVMDAGSNTIADNTIASEYQGIDICGSSDNAVLRNIVGTNSSLAPDFGVSNQGISIFGGACLTGGGSIGPAIGNVIGTSGNGNVVVNSALNGIAADSDRNVVVANSVQNTKTGAAIEVDGDANAIGPDNILTDNAHDGVAVDGGTGNEITRNSIDLSGELGIDLASDGVTPNDPGDVDSGANDLQNFPVITSAAAGATKTHIDATLDTVVPGTYRIEVFNSSACDPSGNGEGATFVGYGDIAFATANQAFAITVGTALAAGSVVTMTATAPDGSTSEFSGCATVTSSASGTLQGSVLASPDPPSDQSVDLSAIGTEDWAVWGYAAGGTSTSLAPDVRKAGGSAIGDLTNIDPAPSVDLRGIGQFPEPYAFSWNNGSGPATATSASAGLQHDGQTQERSTRDHGFAFDVPADTSPRTLRVYVLTNRADGQLTATLSDDSAAPYLDTLPAATDTRTGVYTVTYAAQSAGQTLHVQWIETADTCGMFHCDNAAIFAAALTDPSTLVVNDPGDAGGSTCGATCTLRQAINAANLAPGSKIIFNLPDDQTTISPESNLPAITAPTTIDATTQPGYSGSPLVTLDGSTASSNGQGLRLTAGNSTIRGFVITGWSDAGVFVSQQDGNTVAGNYIGVDAGGIGAQNGEGVVIRETSDGNTIGGTGAGDRNVISGNSEFGIDIGLGEGASSDGNVIQGNYIGLAPDGTTVRSNFFGGIAVGGTNNTIGGTTAAARNVISGNGSEGGVGILLQNGNNVVQGNYIGTDATGTLGAGNYGDGIDDDPYTGGTPGNTIGGPAAGAGNVISGNFGDGIFLGQVDGTNAVHELIQGNRIGTDAAGTGALGNSFDGIETNDASLLDITGNTISANLNNGIEFFGFGSHNNLIEANKIGTNAAGTASLANGNDGILVDESAPNRIHANVISGNDGSGVEISGPNPEGAANFVTGNLIGTSASGAQAIGNGTGVLISGATDNAVGGTAIGDGNVISGNTEAAVDITGAGTTGNTVAGNTIGLNLAGAASVPNGTGVVIESGADSNTVGGTLPLAPNVIAGNGGPGVLIDGAGNGGNAVIGNKIGTNAAATATFGNTVGVRINSSSNNTIGQTAANQANVIGGNAGAGVLLEGSGSNTNLVEGNFIGTDSGASASLGNTGDGVRVNGPAQNSVVRRNTITHNGGAGVEITGSPPLNTNITANSIDLNVGLGIDLGATGVTPNDNPDVDHFQNFPTITSVATTTIGGSLSSLANTTYNIDLFVSPACDPSGNGEGATYLGSTTAVTNGGATGTFLANVPALPSGHFVTATATDPNGNTSEFSACVPTVVPPVAAGLSLTPSAPNVAAGAARVKLADVPPSALLQTQSSQQTAPVNQTPVNQTPINQLATTSAPVNQTPINQTPVNQSGFAELTQSIFQLGSIPLSTIPLVRTGGWTAVLAGTPLATTPQQNVTLRDVYALMPLPGPLQANATNPITIGELDLSRSPLGGLPAMAFALGKLPLSEIHTTTGTFTDWCAAAGVTGVNCTSSTSTVLSAGLQGAPVNQTPVNQTPVNQTLIQALAAVGAPVNQTPVNQTPINQTRIGALPVNQTPVNQTPVNQTPVNQLSLEAILAANAPVNQTPVNQTPINQLGNPGLIVDCTKVNCTTGTLGDAFAAHAILSGITLGDLRRDAPESLLAAWTIADLRYYDGMTIGGLLASLPQPNSFTLADVLLLVLGSPSGSQGLSFEGINVFDTGLPGIATGGSTVGYRARFTVQPNGGASGIPSPVNVTTTLASGFQYVAASSKLVRDPFDCTASGTPLAEPGATTLNDGRLKLDWTVNTTVGDGYSICLTARPGVVLGPQAASLDAKPAGGTTASAAGAALAVGDTLEPNDAPATAPEIFNDSFYLSYLTTSSDIDYYRFAAPPAGTTLTFHLSHLPADYDLVVYGPPETQLRPSIADVVPLDEPPVTDSGADLTHATDSLPSQTLDDLRLQPDLPLVGVSANRGTDPEDVVVNSQGTGFYTVQVTGYNGATSASPYMLRVATAPQRVTSAVPSRTVSGGVGPALPGLPAGLNTVFVADRQRLESFYGNTRANNVMNELSHDSRGFKNLGFPNVILSVDRFSSVQSAYAAWDAHPGDSALANAVVRAINDVVDSQIRSQPNGAGLKYIVIVGGDQVIPFARLDDFTVTASNEAGYASTFDRTTDLFSTLNAGQMLSDDPYGTTAPVPYLTRQLYVPDLSVGRLVETPEEIVGTLGRFLTFSGRLDPATSLTTGYDFLFDGSQRVNGALASRVGTANARSLLDDPDVTGDSWTLAQLIGAFLPTSGAPSITSLNGHASHYQFQPPASDTTGAPSPLFTTSALTSSTSALTNRLVFSMGCHAGLSVADSIVTTGGAPTLDWPQAFAQKGAGAFLGNTGYGYGDSLVVAYSEELNRLFAVDIAAGSTVGNALAAAKQSYFGELGVFGVYDEKSMAEFTLYGLPMWGVSGPGGTPPAPQAQLAPDLAAPSGGAASQPLAVVPDPATGLDAETFSTDPTNTQHPAGAAGTYWSGPDGVQITHLRPIQPKAIVPLTSTNAHGALLTELSSSDVNCIDPVFARPIVDLKGNERELAFTDTAFPSKIQTVRTFKTPAGRMQQLVLVTGQFFTAPCTTNHDPQIGVQRLFGHVAGRVFQSSSNDYVAPAFQLINATRIGGNGAFSIDVTDRAPGGPGAVKEVVVGVRSGNAASWTFINLTQSAAAPARWTGGVPVSGSQFEYFVQAVDAAGNVGVSTNKGFYFSGAPAPAPPTGGLTADLTGPQTNGWFTGSPNVAITAPPGVTFQVSLDGGPYGPAPSSIAGDGVHVLDVRASNGGAARLFAAIDTTPPEIVVTTPASGAQYALNSVVKADYFCRDAGSGVATGCSNAIPNGGPIDTSTPGTKTFTVSAATDAAGHTTPAKVVTYTVGLTNRKILFSSQRSGDGDIYAMNPDGSGLVRLTAAAKVDEQPAWSPNGRKIAFASRRDESGGSDLDIYVMDADGQNVQRLTSAKSDDTAPAWSPDGTKIAFQSKRDGAPEIWVMNADGSGQTRLTNSAKQDIEPTWSPDGSKIAFMSDRMGGPNIWVMDANGANATQLTFTKAPDGDPAWSPDGTRIAFASKREDKDGSKFDIFSMSPTGANIVRLTTAKEDDVEPTWSRDGRKIAFTSNRDSPKGNSEIYVMNADGSGQTRLTDQGGFDRQPDW